MLTGIFRISLLVALTMLSFDTTAAQRTFVSTSGSDANTASNCSTTAPCRGFGAALTVTDSGGEIIVLSSGGYGAVTINKSVSIIAPEGIYAGISVYSGNGVTIATAGVNVVLRGLSVNRLGGSGNGISMTAGDSLVMRNCVISHFSSGYGLHVAVAAEVSLLDSLIHGNYIGAYIDGGSTILVSGSRFLDSTTEGLYVRASGAGVVTRADVSRSEASSNGDVGFYADAASSGRVELNLRDSVSSRNAHGVYTYGTTGTALARVSNSLISGNSGRGLSALYSGAKLVASSNRVTDNGTGLYQASSAVLQSTGDNTLSDNAAASVGTITSLANM